MLADSTIPTDEIIDVGTFSGGGAIGIWSWSVAMGLHRAGYELEMVGGSSTGCIVAFLYAKGMYDEADKLYRLTYEQESRNIFEPGIGKVEKGKFKINWVKAIPAIFKVKKVKSLMTNKGLYETFIQLQKKKPGFDKEMFFNTISQATGKGIQHAASDFKGRDEQLCAALTASTSMPGILPWYDTDEFKVLQDGGTVTGLPFREMFQRMIPGKPYRFWNIMCNPIDLVEDDEISNIAQIAGRSLSIMLNNNLVSDIRFTNHKNEVAKVIWPMSDKLEAMGLHDLAAELRTNLGYKYMPIHNIIYSGKRGIFDFTMESYNEQISTARADLMNYLSKIQ